MKKYCIPLIFCVLLTACNNNPDGFRIEGTLSGEITEGVQIFLRKSDEKNQLIDIDTTGVTNGEFFFTGEATTPELHYIFVEGVSGNVPFILENGNIEVKAQKDSLRFARIKGTPQNNLFSDFLKESRSMASRAQSMTNDMRTATSQRDTVVMNSLREEYFELQEEAKKL